MMNWELFIETGGSAIVSEDTLSGLIVKKVKGISLGRKAYIFLLLKNNNFIKVNHIDEIKPGDRVKFSDAIEYAYPIYTITRIEQY